MIIRRTAAVGAAAAVALAAGTAMAVALATPANYGTAALSGRSGITPALAFRAGSAPSGEFFSPADRTTAGNNNVFGPATGPYFTQQPIQGISAVIPQGTTPGYWWALSDNGYGARANSADYQLTVYNVRAAFPTTPGSGPGSVDVLGSFSLSDPDHHVPWAIVCDQTGAALPGFDFNGLPATPPALCATGDRVLTGFDFDPESLQQAKDGSFWIGEEFGPFLLHVDATGKLLEAPIAVPGVKSPQNPTIDIAAGERPTASASKGFEGLGISPDRRYLYGLLEGSLTGDNPSDLRIYRYDTRQRKFSGYQTYRTEFPAVQVNTSTLKLADGTFAYPGDVAPVGTGPAAIGELTLLDSRDAVIIERDGGGDAPNAPRFKKIFPIRFDKSWSSGTAVGKTPALIDLLAVPDPNNLGGDGAFFRFPFTTIESVYPVDDHTLLVANDNNYPFSNGRAFSQGKLPSGDPRNPAINDTNEFITVTVGGDLDVDSRLLTGPAPRN